jgi:hypothetical protein
MSLCGGEQTASFGEVLLTDEDEESMSKDDIIANPEE